MEYVSFWHVTVLLRGENLNTMKKKTKALLDTVMAVGLEISAKQDYVCICL
jgi:hypothetical protein